MKTFVKLLVPNQIRQTLREIEKRARYAFRSIVIKLPVALGRPMKIIVGAALTHQRGWYSTNEQWLDITRPEDWARVFKGKMLLTNVMAEHVFEHLSDQETRTALRLIASHMVPHGRIRIAVPDGYHPDPVYLKHVGVRGIGADAADHKQLLNADTLSLYLKDAGFTAEVLEGYLKTGELVTKTIDISGGQIMRSRTNSKNMNGWDFTDAQTSLILDGTTSK